MGDRPFLSDSEHQPRPLNEAVEGLTPQSLFVGQGSNALEVAVFTAATPPADTTLRNAYTKRQDRRATPVLVVALHSEGVSLCGASGDEPSTARMKDCAQAERLCDEVLYMPDRNTAIRFIASAMHSLETRLPGIINQGLLSLHELDRGTRKRSDWNKAVERAEQVVSQSGEDILTALGFKRKRLDNMTEILTDKGQEIALAILLKEDEIPEASSQRLNNTSPVSYALTQADKKNLPWVIMYQKIEGGGGTNAHTGLLRLYNTQNIGIGRRGRTETYIECQPTLLSSDDLGLLWLIFSAEALQKDGTIHNILEESKRFAAGVADKLRERIYDTVIPELAMGMVDARNIKKPTKGDIALTYEMALTVMFRLLFIAYAEDMDLLLSKGNEKYKRRSLKQKAIELADETSKPDKKEGDENNHHWDETKQLWQAISKGNRELGVPAYNGAMFSDDEKVSRAGAELAKISLPNRRYKEALSKLLLTESPDGEVPIDFRELSVREFGTIYEGLLESELSLAEQDLTLDKKGTYIPTRENEQPDIKAGQVYLHNKSGARKSSGSYYTPEFAVEHLLDGALKPALDEHLERIDKLSSDADKADQFFDFRVADIAMGSGHFLVLAIDHIERRFASYLEEKPIPGITRELEHLRDAARKCLTDHLGALADSITIEDGQLLRRMIARRCIYGVDLNPLTVQLARLSIWIHTFVPGLPLSLLDHNLAHGNGLVGIGTLDEIRQRLEDRERALFRVDVHSLLDAAKEPLEKLAKLSDASVKDIEEGRKLMEEAWENTSDIRDLCNVITAQPLAEDETELKNFSIEDWDEEKEKPRWPKAVKQAGKILDALHPLHFPIAFPEVFLGKQKGFNVILGNPPWEKIRERERDFWTRNFPGIRGLSQKEQVQRWKKLAIERPDLTKEWEITKSASEHLASILKMGNFPGLSVGDSDLYKAFSWQFWHLSSEHLGKIGVVLPRSAFINQGSTEFRKELFTSAESVEVTTLLNSGGWIFDMEPRYTITLTYLSKSKDTKESGIEIRGPYDSRSNYEKGMVTEAMRFPVEEVLSWSDEVAIPLFPTNESVEVFKQLRKAPRLDHNVENEWRARSDRELDAALQKPLMDLENKECPEGFWPVYKGASYDLWQSDRGDEYYYAWANPKVILSWLQKKRLRASQGKRDSVHREFSIDYVKDESTLAPYSARIAFRLITRSTDSRTTRVVLTPPNVFHSHSSQPIMWPRGDRKDEAYLLGILSSRPLDWYARRFVEVNFTLNLFNSLPIPRPKRSNPLWKRVVKLAGRLACPDDRFSDWAKEVGVECGPLKVDDKQDKIHELDAVVAHLYGLSKKQLTHIYETFHKGWDYKADLEEVLRHYKNWESRKK